MILSESNKRMHVGECTSHADFNAQDNTMIIARVHVWATCTTSLSTRNPAHKKHQIIQALQIAFLGVEARLLGWTQNVACTRSRVPYLTLRPLLFSVSGAVPFGVVAYQQL